jgi:hypothetical protein
MLHADLLGQSSSSNDDEGEFNMYLKFSTVQTQTHYDALQMDYTDQAYLTHHIVTDFSLGNNPTLYSIQLSYFSRLFKNGFYLDPFNANICFGHKSDMFQFGSCAGYGVRFKKKWSLIASATSGFAMYEKVLHPGYFSTLTPVVANGKTIVGDFRLELHSHAMFVKPLLTLQYQINGLSINLFGGYQFNAFYLERVGISEKTYRSAAKTAYLSTSESIKSNGQYVTGKLMNLNGFVIGIGAVVNVNY